MAILKWLLSGFAGGAIAAVVWVLMAYQSDSVYGFAALAVGIMSGITVRLSSRYDQTPPTRMQSIIAAMTTLLLVLGAHYLIANIRVEQMIDQQQTSAEQASIEIAPDQLPTILMRDEAGRRMNAGEELQWPEGMGIETATLVEDFPPEIISWGQEKYDAMSPQQREEMIAAREKLAGELKRQIELAVVEMMRQPDNTAKLRNELYRTQLLPKHSLWILLAMGMAFWFSSERRSDENTATPATEEDASQPVEPPPQ